MDRFRPVLAIGAVLLLVLLLPGPAPARGAAPAAVAPLGIPIPMHAVAVQISNTQTSPTGTYQQMVVVNSSLYASWLNANESNVEWRYVNGTPIPAWMESNASSSATRTTWWLKLWNIPASSSVNVYLDFYATSSLQLSRNGPTGEAPQLSTGYGVLDDGSSVFGNYHNFSSATSDPLTGWSGQNYAESAGLTWSTSNTRFFIIGPTTIPGSNLTVAEERVHSTNWDIDFTVESSTGANDWDCTGNTVLVSPRTYGGWGTAACFGPRPVNVSRGFVLLGFLTNEAVAYLNDTIFATQGAGVNSITNWYFSGGVGTYNGNVSFVRTRTLPNVAGVMPSTTFPTPPLPGAPIVTHTNSSSIGISWTQAPNGVVDDTIHVANDSGGNCLSPGVTVDTGGAVTSWNVTNLSPSHTYCLTVADRFAGFVSSAFTFPPLIANTTNATVPVQQQLPGPASLPVILGVAAVLILAAWVLFFLIPAYDRRRSRG